MLGFGSGVYTAKQTRRVRETYDIPGTYSDDVVKGIFCLPCSQIRNELEVRTREAEKQGRESGYLEPPVPLGETYRPMDAMTGEDPYESQPPMRVVSPTPTDSNITGQTLPENRMGFPRMTPVYPNGMRPDSGGLQSIRQPVGPDASDRRGKMLTPILEGGEDVERSRYGENTPLAGAPPTFVPHEPLPLFEHQAPRTKSPNLASLAPPKLGASDSASAALPHSHDSRENPTESYRPVLVIKPVRHHDLESHPKTPIQGLVPAREHSISDDAPVAIPEAVETRAHEIDVHDVIHVSKATPTREHRISADDILEVTVQPRQHTTSPDSPVAENKTPEQGRGLETHDTAHTPHITATEGHDIKHDIQVPDPRAKEQVRQHSLSNDRRVPLPGLLAPQSHTVHSDDRVPTPEVFRFKGEHDITKDVLVQSSDLLPTVAHDIAVDERTVSSPEPASEEHDLHADERTKTAAVLPPNEHPIHADAAVPELPRSPQQHGIAADQKVVELSSQPPGVHPLGRDQTVAERANQLLDDFFGSSGKGGN
ncbi:hypothetical protein GQ53DRAFT_419682 [Thozetella sp. PMI_491]|nr:hypothetical protein GQ53DRAFT_419682 [Thozetella sp. PMI_491]